MPGLTGRMYACGGRRLSVYCDPKDVWASVEKNRENYFFTDIQVRGNYPSYAEKLFERENIRLKMKENDLEILKENTVDFVSLSYYNSRCVRADGKCEAAGGNVFASAKNPHLTNSQWGWPIDPLGLRDYVKHAVRQISKTIVYCGKRTWSERYAG